MSTTPVEASGSLPQPPSAQKPDAAASRRRFPAASLLPLFQPRSVAVIGATEREGSVGRTVTANLLAKTFRGAVFPVNPTRPSVLGVPAFPSIRALPERPDVAVIVTPATTVPQLVRECADGGVRAAIVISAGFKELGPDGQQLEQEVLQVARERGITVQPMIKLDGYELILGSIVDEQFGPIVLFGSGEQLVEVYGDRAVALPPLNATLAQRLMEKTKIYAALKGVRGRPPVHFAELQRALIRFGTLLIEQPRIKECDINPLLASPAGVTALDARVVLYGPEQPLETLPPPAVRPYPTQYISQAELRDGTRITIRPIRLEDESLMVEFHESLSPESVHLRYWHAMDLSLRTGHERLVRICDTDFDREVAVVAEHQDATRGKRQILGVGRLSRDPGADVAEFAVVVRDAWQGKGVGTRLLGQFIEIGRRERIRRILGHILTGNRAMQMVCRQLGFELHHDPQEGEVRAELQIVGE